MSVSFAVAAKQEHVASLGAPKGAVSRTPWGAPAEPGPGDGFELSGAVLHVAPDRQIYAEGDEARSFYKVVSGVVRTCRFLSDGRRQIDSFHVTGDVFGFEVGADHRLAAEAVSHCTVIAYRRRGLETMVTQDDRLGRWFFSHAMTTLARVREHSLLLGRSSAAQKISTFLLEIEEQDGNHSLVDLVMGRQDIADYLGLTIETVSRTLSQLERDGTIGLPAARKIVLKDRQALRALNS
jgi:CRP/FNR family nitrogen fixation transcriptional regulator